MKEINIRRSVRNFSNKEISKEDLLKILKAGMQAPSAGNQQAWEFVVIEDKNRLLELKNVSKYALPLSRANKCIIVLGNSNKARFIENLEQDLGAVCQNMLLEATHLGIGSLWTSVSPLEDRMTFVKEFINADYHVLPYAIIAFGYPENEGVFKEVNRFDENKIHYDTY